MPKLTPTSELHRILISRTDDLGDVILTLPLAVAIKKRLPEVELTFLVRPYISHLVERIPEIDKTLTLPESGHGREIFQEYNPDAIIFAWPVFRLALDAMRARVDVRIGTGYCWFSGLFTRWVYDKRKKGASHEAEFELNMLSPILDGPFELEMPELPVSTEGEAEAKKRLHEIGIEGDYVIIHPVGRPYLPQYPTEHFAEVGRQLLESHPDISVVVTAGPNELPIAEEVCKQINLPSRTAALTKLSPNGVSELLRGGQCFIGSPSHGTHLAALVRTPVVAVYPGVAPDWPERRRPIGPNVITLTPQIDEPIPAGAKRKGKPEYILARIAPQRVLDACLKILEEKDNK